MAPTLWPLEPQTLGKHLVLRNYLDGWLPILGRWNGRLLFIDGFAGPGEYEGGQKGSPLVAMECVRQHKEMGRLRGTEVVFLCMESDVSRADHLRRLLESQAPTPNTTFHVLDGDFDGHMTRLLNLIDEQNATLAPSFVMVDPFGVKGSRMQLIGRVLAMPSAVALRASLPCSRLTPNPLRANCAAGVRDGLDHDAANRRLRHERQDALPLGTTAQGHAPPDGTRRSN